MALDLTGQVYGLQKVIKRVGLDTRTRSPIWITECTNCGKTRNTTTKCLRRAEDLVLWAIDILKRHKPGLLKESIS